MGIAATILDQVRNLAHLKELAGTLLPAEWKYGANSICPVPFAMLFGSREILFVQPAGYRLSLVASE